MLIHVPVHRFWCTYVYTYTRSGPKWYLEMRVSIYIEIHTNIPVHVQAHAHTHKHVSTRAHKRIHVHEYIHTHIMSPTWMGLVSHRLYTAHMYTHIHTCIHTYIHTKSTHVYTHTYMYTHIHTYKEHTCIHTYIHTKKLMCRYHVTHITALSHTGCTIPLCSGNAFMQETSCVYVYVYENVRVYLRV